MDISSVHDTRVNLVVRYVIHWSISYWCYMTRSMSKPFMYCILKVTGPRMLWKIPDMLWCILFLWLPCDGQLTTPIHANLQHGRLGSWALESEGINIEARRRFLISGMFPKGVVAQTLALTPVQTNYLNPCAHQLLNHRSVSSLYRSVKLFDVTITGILAFSHNLSSGYITYLVIIYYLSTTINLIQFK